LVIVALKAGELAKQIRHVERSRAVVGVLVIDERQIVRLLVQEEIARVDVVVTVHRLRVDDVAATPHDVKEEPTRFVVNLQFVQHGALVRITIEHVWIVGDAVRQIKPQVERVPNGVLSRHLHLASKDARRQVWGYFFV